MLWVVIGTISIVITTIAAGLLLDRRFGILPRRERLAAGATRKQLAALTTPAHNAGEAPATALAGDLVRLRTRHCSRCKARMRLSTEEPIQYDGRELRVLAFTCPRCEHPERLYVDPS